MSEPFPLKRFAVSYKVRTAVGFAIVFARSLAEAEKMVKEWDINTQVTEVKPYTTEASFP